MEGKGRRLSTRGLGAVTDPPDLCVVVGDDGFLGEVNLSRMWSPVLSQGLTYTPYTLEAVNLEEN